ncbi:MAG: aminopeptidase P family protein [Candidatus Riflebacteria bacterium]|nr:aminopeptidase P family protein [Candidatus Riflebacteria bacterium]
MFPAETYTERRQALISTMNSFGATGVLLFIGLEEVPMNYCGNTYSFHQDGSFSYFWGLGESSLAAVIDLDSHDEILFCDERSIDDEIWMGPLPLPADRAGLAGVHQTHPTKELAAYLQSACNARRHVHVLPPYRARTTQTLDRLLGADTRSWKARASADFIRAVVKLRSIKSSAEIAEIEKALDISHAMYTRAFGRIVPGRFEREIVGAMEGAVLEVGSRTSFPTICSVRGEILHNHNHANIMRKGDLLVLDSGAESSLGYSSDITRTVPVSGKFTPAQREIYEIVLAAQTTAIKMIRPGIFFRDVHIAAARVIASGLKQAGLLKGNPDDAVEAGAHALFFPHGLGHMIGLDVHDMESLGEDFVGYDEETTRSEQFGLAYLRLARRLQTDFTVTVEPGIYFIPALIDIWRNEARHRDFIDYDRVAAFRGFGGIRIEDDVVVTSEGSRVLGKPIPKTVAEIEASFLNT